jgi:hypothetical protein
MKKPEKLNKIKLDNNTVIYSKKSEEEVRQIFEERRLNVYKSQPLLRLIVSYKAK